MSFIIFDTEYTTWPGCQENGWQNNQKKEIVQIAALKISDDWSVTDRFNTLCQPIINPILSDYFIRLTRITNEQIQKKGESFASAYQKFESFVGNDICYSHAWGSDYRNESDGNIIRENLRLYQVTASKKIIYRNIAPVFSRLYQENNITISKQASGEIVHLLGIEKNLTDLGLNVHNAFYDVYSIFEGLKFFYPQSKQLMEQLSQIQF